jgi:hypothetical protein
MLLVSAGFLVLIVICLFIVLFATRSGPTPSNPPSPQVAAPPTAGEHADDGDQAIPATAPPGVSWTVFHGMALPGSQTFGPTQVTGDVAAGYAHSPTGALIAAANISIRYAFADNWRDVLSQQTAPGPGQRSFAALRAPYPVDDFQPGSRGTFTAFRFVNYTPQLATIQFVTQFAAYGGAQQLSTLTVQWSGTDWLLVLQPNGAAGPPATPVISLDGFTPWGPS